MSRFWQAQSSSEDEKDDVSETFEEPIQAVKQADRKFAAAFDESDSDSDDEVRVVKSHKDRAWDSIKDGIGKIKNARKNGDWPLIQDEFNNVNKLIDKSKMLILKDGLPKFYIVMLAELEQHVQEALKDKESVKKMKPLVSRALNQMKLQVRKHNDSYKSEISDFKEHPEKYAASEAESSSSSSEDDSSDEDSDDSSDSSNDDDSDDSSDESEKKPAKAPVKQAASSAPKSKFLAGNDSDSDADSLFGPGVDDDLSSDSEEEGEGRQELKGRAKWLKKAVTKPVAKKPIFKPTGSNVPVKPQSGKPKPDTTVVAQVVAAPEEKITEEDLDKKVNELVASRGRKGIDSKDVLRQLELLSKAARVLGPRKEIPILMHLISAMFDSQKNIDDYMDKQQWYMCFRSLTRVIHLLDQNKSLELAPMGLEELSDLTLSQNKANFALADAGKNLNVEVEKKPINEKIIHVSGNIESFLSRLGEEYTKSLQQINPHTKVRMPLGCL